MPTLKVTAQYRHRGQSVLPNPLLDLDSVNRNGDDLALARFRIDVMAALDARHISGPANGLTRPRPGSECLPRGAHPVPSSLPARRRLPRERWPAVQIGRAPCRERV